MKTLKLWLVFLWLLILLPMLGYGATPTVVYTGDWPKTNTVKSTNLIQIIIQRPNTSGTSSNGFCYLVPMDKFLLSLGVTNLTGVTNIAQQASAAAVAAYSNQLHAVINTNLMEMVVIPSTVTGMLYTASDRTNQCIIINSTFDPATNNVLLPAGFDGQQLYIKRANDPDPSSTNLVLRISGSMDPPLGGIDLTNRSEGLWLIYSANLLGGSWIIAGHVNPPAAAGLTWNTNQFSGGNIIDGVLLTNVALVGVPNIGGTPVMTNTQASDISDYLVLQEVGGGSVIYGATDITVGDLARKSTNNAFTQTNTFAKPVAIGTNSTTAGYMLEVQGPIKVTADASGIPAFRVGASGWTNWLSGYPGATDYNFLNAIYSGTDWIIRTKSGGTHANEGDFYLGANGTNIITIKSANGSVRIAAAQAGNEFFRIHLPGVPDSYYHSFFSQLNASGISSRLVLQICDGTPTGHITPLVFCGDGVTMIGSNTVQTLAFIGRGSTNIALNSTGNRVNLVAATDTTSSNVLLGVSLGGQIFSSPTNYTAGTTTNFTINWQGPKEQMLVLTNAAQTNGIFLYSANHAAAYALAANGAVTPLEFGIYNAQPSAVPITFTNGWHHFTTIVTNIPAGKWLWIKNKLIAGTADESGVHCWLEPEN